MEVTSVTRFHTVKYSGFLEMGKFVNLAFVWIQDQNVAPSHNILNTECCKIHVLS